MSSDSCCGLMVWYEALQSSQEAAHQEILKPCLQMVRR